MTSSNLSISAVERETRLSKDVLRAWEKRYGFPVPERDENGERCYPFDQVERLRLMKRLMDQGLRPGRLAALPADELARLAQRQPAGGDVQPDADGELQIVDALLALVKQDPAAFQHALQRELARLGLERFVEGVAAPLTAAIGSRWEDGSFDIHDEHFCTEALGRILRQSVGSLPAGRAPHILLTSLPGETHALGLAMAEALLALDGAACLPLGTETPPSSIVRAATALSCDIVALSFSAAYPRRQVGPALLQLRQALPTYTALWAGGAGVRGLASIPGVRLLATLGSGRQALAEWRNAQAGV